MVDFRALFASIKPKKIFLLGDVILDKYIYGVAKRISPEAPVPVVLVKRTEDLVGGAANVAKNLRVLGMEVTIASVVGLDSAATVVEEKLHEIGCHTHFIREKEFKTPEKTRVIAAHQQVVRVDNEKYNVLTGECEARFIQEIEKIIPQHDLVAISDYAKGSVTPKIVQHVISCAKKYGIPVVVDPKSVDVAKYSGATLLKPNRAEAYGAAGLSESAPLTQVAERIFAKTDIEVLMVTRSEEGISLFFRDGTNEEHAAYACEVSDVTGAGDTVLATVSACLANRLSVSDAARAANIAGACAVEHVGCAAISLDHMLARV